MNPLSLLQHRTELLLGEQTVARLHAARVIIFGVGGVGSWCAEALVRSGIGHLTMVDMDCVAESNCNRQLMATTLTIGQPKVEVLRERLQTISPEADIVAMACRYTPETAEQFRLETYDVVIDAIDSLPDKADLILRTTRLPKTTTLFSSMGAALRVDPFAIRKAEFWSVKGDALARALRNRFKRQNTFPARKFYCVYSEEPARSNQRPAQPDAEPMPNGSLCPITGIFGMSIAGMVIQSFLDKEAGNE